MGDALPVLGVRVEVRERRARGTMDSDAANAAI